MTHWRTSRATPLGGGRQSPGSPYGSKYALPQHSILSPGSSLERGEVSQALINERELRACLVFLTLLGLAAVIVFIVGCGFDAFIAESIQD